MFRGLCIIEDQGGSTVAWTTLPRLDDCAAVVLVGSRLGAAKPLAESFNSLYKATHRSLGGCVGGGGDGRVCGVVYMILAGLPYSG